MNGVTGALLIGSVPLADAGTVFRGVDPTRVPGLLAAHRSAIEDATN